MTPLFTREEVEEAMAILRRERSSIPDDCLDQMEEVLLEAVEE